MVKNKSTTMPSSLKITNKKGKHPILAAAIFQGEGGGIYVEFEPNMLLLDKENGLAVCEGIPDFDKDDFHNFYIREIEALCKKPTKIE